MPYPEPSIYDHDAPWNLGEDGECCCFHCKKKRRKEAEEERDIEDLDYGKPSFRE